MTITEKRAAKRSPKTPLLLRAAAALAITAGLLGSGPVAAQAATWPAPSSGTLYGAGDSVSLSPGQYAIMWTNWNWYSTVCVTNNSYKYGEFTLHAVAAAPEENIIAPYSKKCRSAWWFGTPVQVENSGTTTLLVKRTV